MILHIILGHRGAETEGLNNKHAFGILHTRGCRVEGQKENRRTEGETEVGEEASFSPSSPTL